VFPLKDNIPTSGFPVVTVVLIVLNVLSYFLFQHGTITLGDPSDPAYQSNLFRYAFYPWEVTHWGQQCVAEGQHIRCATNVGAGYPPTLLTLFTAMFMHGGLLHLGGNMLFLWIFGNNVEDSMGRVRFVIFYLLASLAALALQVAIDPSSTVPTLGASGAIAGVLGGYILLWPRARVLTVIFIIIFFTLVEIPALYVLGFWFLLQAVSGAYDLAQPTGGGGGVAYFAHIGGFLFGLLAIKAFAQRVKQVPSARFPVY